MVRFPLYFIKFVLWQLSKNIKHKDFQLYFIQLQSILKFQIYSLAIIKKYKMAKDFQFLFQIQQRYKKKPLSSISKTVKLFYISVIGYKYFSLSIIKKKKKKKK